MLNSLSEIDPSFFNPSDENDVRLFSVIAPVITYIAILAVIGVGFVVWNVIIAIKAVKVLNGFSTEKAFGLLILVFIITVVVTYPLGGW